MGQVTAGHNLGYYIDTHPFGQVTNIFDDRIPVDGINGYLIVKWVALFDFKNTVPD